MALQDLLNSDKVSVITDEDRIMHTTKMVERTFGLSAADLGTVEMREGKAVLVFPYNGVDHTLEWRRQPGGAIFWYVDGSERKLVLGDQGRALQRLVAALTQ